MIDHININVRDYEASRAFYVQALKPLGVEVLMEFGRMAGMGNAGKPDLWISERGKPSGALHIAIAAPTAKPWMPSTKRRSRQAA